MKKLFVLSVIFFSYFFAMAQDDGQYFEKDYPFPLALNNGKCSVMGVMDFTNNSSIDDETIFANLYMWITDNIGQDKVIKLSPSTKIISCKYTVKGKNTYFFSTAFRVADKHVYVTQTDLKAIPQISITKKETGMEKYAELKKTSDKAIVDEFNVLNNDLMQELCDFIGSNTPESMITNWDNIVSKRVTEGMTMTETKLALGPPQSVVEGNTETQWIYGLSLIVYFDDGKDYNQATKTFVKRDKKVTRILR
ncbi:MAG: hypothetical protein PUC50_04075 [Bacteroidales bacterium]|nr:hypothetical protein [Bacteroidales bacterium]